MDVSATAWTAAVVLEVSSTAGGLSSRLGAAEAAEAAEGAEGAEAVDAGAMEVELAVVVATAVEAVSVALVRAVRVAGTTGDASPLPRLMPRGSRGGCAERWPIRPASGGDGGGFHRCGARTAGSDSHVC